jgi:colicin import membrane protein
MSDSSTKQNQAGNGKTLGSGRFATYYQIPKEPGRNTALILAGVMHVLLFLFLWVGIHWQSKTPVGVDAEIWDMTTRQAAPEPEPVVVTPPPVQQVEPPEPPKPSAREIQEERDAEIVLERAKEKRIADKKLLEEQKELKKEKDLAEKEQKKLDAAKLAEQKKLDEKEKKLREDNLKRMTSQIAGTGTSGDAVKSTGNNRVDAGYAGKIAAKIKSNMVYVGSDSVTANPTVEFTIDLFPDGSLRGSPKKTKSSGVAAFDDAVERAIVKSAPYPPDKSGNVPPTFSSTYRLKDYTE